MKRIFFIFSLIMVALISYGQEISRPSSSSYNVFSRNSLFGNYSYWNYEGVSTDLLVPTTSDTIDIRYQVKKHKPFTVKLISKFNPIAGADTIVYINVLGRNSENESWTSIIADSSAVVSEDGIVKSVSSATSPTYAATIAAHDIPFTNPAAGTADTLEVPLQTISLTETSTLLEYRYILVRYILAGDDSVGTGVELIQSELIIVEH